MAEHKKFLIPVLLTVFLVTCAGSSIKPEPVKGIYHRVKKGETLYAISRAYNTDLQELAEVNNITNPAVIEAGTAVFIPGADKVVEVPLREPQSDRDRREPAAKKTLKPSVPAMSPSGAPGEIRKSPAAHAQSARPAEVKTGEEPAAVKKPLAAKPAPVPPPEETSEQAKTDKPAHDRIEFDRKRFIWPIKGEILSRYGIQPNGSKNNGIRIAGEEDMPVLAAAAGEVTYSDTLKYYGETIILKHDDNFSTVYTTLKSRNVKVGDRVKKGDKIALIGKNEAGRAFLTFEIRRFNKPRNPLFFLP